MSGMFESWMQKLVAAVMQRESEANVVVVNWVPMAQQLYPDAVNHTVTVGQNIADLLNWLQVSKTLRGLCICQPRIHLFVGNMPDVSVF